MNLKKFDLRQVLMICALGLVCMVGVYFRTYPLHHKTFITQPTLQEAENLVRKSISRQIEMTMNMDELGISGQRKKELVQEKVKAIIKTDKENFASAVSKTFNTIKSKYALPSSRQYLQGADSYYYYYLSDNIRSEGNVSAHFKNGKFFDPLKGAPLGTWSLLNFHPFMGYYWYRFLRIFNTSIEFMDALCFLPLILMILGVISFLFVCNLFKTRILSIFVGLISFVFAPVFIQRSSFGWYDTDPYNCIFILLIFGLTLKGLGNERKKLFVGMISGFLTGLYALFWVGWPFIFTIVVCSSLVIVLIGRIEGKDTELQILPYFFGYLFMSILSLFILLTPMGFGESIGSALMALTKFIAKKPDLWPNIFLTVGEARAISFKKLIFLTGNYVSFGFLFLGIFGAGIKIFKEGIKKETGKIIVLCVLTVATLFLSLKTERFSLLFVLPLSIWVVLGVDTVIQKASQLASSGRFNFLKSFWAKGIGVFLILGIFLPAQLLFAHVSALNSKMIMNDAWFNHLKTIKKNTPENAVILSWWSPGYFIMSIANRGVVIDGGTQHRPETYWIARFFMTDDEKEAMGILRMLSAGGNGAVDFLEERGFDLVQAMNLMNKLLVISKKAARSKLSGMFDKKDSAHLLNLVYGSEKLPPAFVLIYNDLLESNIAMSIMSRWDFGKAKKIMAGKTKGEIAKSNYVKEAVAISGEVLRYTPEASLKRKDGDLLYFTNGLEVNLETKEAWVRGADGVEGRPMSLFHVENGKLLEIPAKDKILNMSALIFVQNGEIKSVLADRLLIRSVLFKLYYLNGRGLRFFRPFLRKKDENSGKYIESFEIQRI